MYKSIAKYTTRDILYTYHNVYDLLLTKHLINTFSTNQDDIRNIAIRNLDLKYVKHVLDLGCGYGFFIEKLQGRLHDDAEIIGIDIVENNREAYLNCIEANHYHGLFINAKADILSMYPDNAFELIICSYSLYFFPHLIQEISRVLASNGLVIIITHNKKSLFEVIQLIPDCMNKLNIGSQSKFSELSITGLLNSFSSEIGYSELEAYFQNIEIIPYNNSLVFSTDHIDDCKLYITLKRNLFFKEVISYDAERVVDMENCIIDSIMHAMEDTGNFSITKDDSIFLCLKPAIK